MNRVEGAQLMNQENHLHDVAMTAPIDASLVVCNAHGFCFSEVERGNSPVQSIPEN